MKTTNLFDLKKAVEHDPQLLEYVEKLGESQYRLSKLLFDLGRLDESLNDRLKLFSDYRPADPVVKAMSDNFAALIEKICFFLRHATTDAHAVEASAATEYSDLMARLLANK